MFFTPDQLAVAHESFRFWRPLVQLPVQAWALLGCEGGETGFKWTKNAAGHMETARGDRGQAYSSFQWHWTPRGETILHGDPRRRLKGCGIDVRTYSHLDSLRAAHYEMTIVMPKVWRDLMAADTLWAAEHVLVHEYEISRNQTSDIAKRSAIAGWLMASQAGWEDEYQPRLKSAIAQAGS